jgi:hypothetical protein
MLNVLAILAAVVIGQGDDKLEIVNARPTFGHLGANRPLTGALPGDVVHFSFDIKNLKTDAGGRAAYSMEMEVKDAKGELLYHLKPQNGVAQNFFGGNILPASSFLEVPLDAKPGIVAWKVTVVDRTTKKKATLDGKGKILPADFGLIHVATFADREGRVPQPPVGVIGSILHLHFATIGFARDPKTKQPDIEVTLRVLDDKGKATFAEPLKGELKSDVPEQLRIVGMQFAVTMNRVGHFTAELEGRCRLSGKTSKVTLPVRILANE